ncbi:MAG: hypothetical protein ABI877_14300, partial [Gemmatimonadaceae bacterium]
TLRPGMTTATAIETYSIPEALSIPLEAVMSEGDIPFVYKRSGSRLTRQEVETGAMNDDEVVIRRGLEEKDEVLLAPPPNKADVETVRLPGSGNKPKVETGDTTQSTPVPVKPSDAKGTARAPSGRPAPPKSRPAPTPSHD